MTINLATDSINTLTEALEMIDTIEDLYGYLPQPEADLKPRINAELARRAA